MSEVLTQAAPVTEPRISQPFRPREPGCGIFDATCAASVAGHALLGPPCFHGVRTQVRRGDGGGHPGPEWYRRCLSGPFSALPRSPGYGPVQRTPIGVRQARKTRRDVELYAARLVKDPGFNNCYMACRVHMDAVRSRTASPEDLVREWDDIMARTKGQVMLPPIDSATTTVPPAVRDQLDALLHRLTDADYRNREHRPDRIVRTIDAATRALENRFTNERRQAERAERRRRREHRARRQQERLDFYLKKKQEGVPSS